jgi:alkyl hydroperoxide reductase subunit F
LSTIAEKVTLVAPSHGELDAALGRTILSADNVEVLEGYQVESVKGDEYARQLGVSKNGESLELEADAFFVELELVPQSDIVADFVERDHLGRIVVDCRNQTSHEGVFAAGDVTNIIAEQVLIAVGEGAKATLTAYEYLLTLE